MVGGPCVADGSIIECQKCYVKFDSEDCYERHKKAMCNYMHFCKKCAKRYRVLKNEHICGNIYCNVCLQNHRPEEFCFIQPVRLNKNKKTQRILVFDFEVVKQFIS